MLEPEISTFKASRTSATDSTDVEVLMQLAGNSDEIFHII